MTIYQYCQVCGASLDAFDIKAHKCCPREDRIADLEKQVEHHKNKAEYLDKRELELLAEAKAKPVAWFDGEHYVCPEIGYEYTITTEHPKALGWKPLYTTPQTKPLTRNEVTELIANFRIQGLAKNLDYYDLVKAIEERHGIK